MDVKQSLFGIFRSSIILAPLFILLTTAFAMAANVTLRWDPNDPSPDGYRVFARRSDQAFNYSNPDWEGNAVSCTIDKLEDQTEYYFVVRAYDGNLESSDSEEVHYIPPISVAQTQDTTAPSWDGATTGAGLVTDTGTGGRVIVEFDTARDGVDGTNLRFNVYYAPSRSWDNADWTRNSVIADAAVSAGSTFTHAVTVHGLTGGVSYTFGVRVEDQSRNEDANTYILKAKPTLAGMGSNYHLMLSSSPNRGGAVLLEDSRVTGKIYVFVKPIDDIKSVKFFIDDVLHQTEKHAPYDLAGGTSSNQANYFKTSNLANGYHTFSAHIIKVDGSFEEISADVWVY